MNNIGKELIHLFKLHRNLLTARLAAIGLFIGQEGLLYHLSITDGQTMSEIVEKMKIQHATLFTMVERMTKNNLITKSKHETDKRASRIFITSKGKRKVSELSLIWQDIEKQLLKGFNKEEIKTSKMIFGKIINNLSNE